MNEKSKEAYTKETGEDWHQRVGAEGVSEETMPTYRYFKWLEKRASFARHRDDCFVLEDFYDPNRCSCDFSPKITGKVEKKNKLVADPELAIEAVLEAITVN